MAFCEGCGTRLVEGARFCTVCGRKASAPSTAATHGADTSASAGSCAYCGARLPAAARFCEVCGRPVQGQNHRESAPSPTMPAELDPAVFSDGEGEPYRLEGELPPPDVIDAAISTTEDAIRAAMREVVELNVTAPSESGESIVASWLG